MSNGIKDTSSVRRAFDWYLPYLLRLVLAMACLTAGRFAFALANRDLFEGVQIQPFWYGLHFDLAALAYWYLPFHLFSLPPFAFLRSSAWRWPARIAFHFCNVTALLLNLIDAGYYSFSKQRSTFEAALSLFQDADVLPLLPHYLLNWWYLVLGILAAIVLTDWIYRRVERLAAMPAPGMPWRLLWMVAIFAVLAAGTRSTRINFPLGVLNACEQVPASLAPVVLNTPFVVIKSFKKAVTVKNYFPEDDLKRRYDPIREFKAQPDARKRNVVFILIESLSTEFVGAYNEGKGYTPFLDQLAQRSTVCRDSFANAKRTIEVGPTVIAGLPMLMNGVFIRSPFAANRLDSLPHLLKPLGYRSLFFHGARPGSMSYDVFAAKAGFDEAYLKNDYPNVADYDGSWGILDEPFLQFMAAKLNNVREPFFGYVHTLTSHHPFKVPAGFEGRFPKGHHPICETIGYTDWAIQRFFETAEKMPWFTNTIFVITADHTANFTHAKAATPLAVFRVPIIIYDPANPIHREIDKPVAHVDLFPTVLDLVGWEGRAVCFGQNVFGDSEGYVVQYLNNNYQAVDRDWCLFFNGQRAVGLFRRATDPLCRTNLVAAPELAGELREREEQLKAYVQSCLSRLVRNELSLQP